jgi:uncharacterized protein (TIGR00725 family)
MPDDASDATKMPDRPYIAVIGAGNATVKERNLAEEVGALLAEANAVLVCGGLGGVMEAACRGASESGGATVGILPGSNRHDANPHVGIVVATGLGEARNAIVVTSADAVIAIGGEYGTLSEIALALRAGRPVIGLDTWELRKHGQVADGALPAEGVLPAGDAEEAVTLALRLARR